MTKKILEEWIYKAEEDFESANYLIKKPGEPVPNAVCFHCQQCIEKYLKAFLIQNDIQPPEIHDLQKLGNICATKDESFTHISDDLNILNAYSVSFRYPGEEATVKESTIAFNTIKKLRTFLRQKIGIKNSNYF